MHRIKITVVIALALMSASLLIWSFIPQAGASADKDPTEDPDRLPGFQGRFDEGEYLRQRDAFIALLRGVDPNKPFDPEARTRAVAKMDEQMAALQQTVEASKGTDQPMTLPNWIELGPNPIPNGQTQTTSSPVSGRVSAIAIDPADPNKVYVGAAQGGVYRSLDGGATWTAIFDTAQTLAIGTLNLDPVNGWLWVGTGEANGSADCYCRRRSLPDRERQYDRDSGWPDQSHSQLQSTKMAIRSARASSPAVPSARS